MRTFKKSTLILAFLSIIVFACEQAEKKVTSTGAEYILISSEDGDAYEEGDFGVFYLKLMTATDSVLIDSKDVGMLRLRVDSATLSKRGPLFSILTDMHLGDSIKSKLSASEIYSTGFGQPLQPGINPNDRITVIATAKEKLDSLGFIAYNRKVEAEMAAERQAQAEEQKELNAVGIKNYIADNNLTIDTASYGLLYAITEKGDGIIPENGQTVSVEYTGMLLNGQVFDTSIEETAKEAGVYNPQRTYQPFSFALGQGSVIRGWDIGIGLLPVGSSATLIIPSELGYGPRGSGAAIPPNSALVFKVKLVSVK